MSWANLSGTKFASGDLRLSQEVFCSSSVVGRLTLRFGSWVTVVDTLVEAFSLQISLLTFCCLLLICS